MKELKDFGLGLSIVLAIFLAIAAFKHSARLPVWAAAFAVSAGFTWLYPLFFHWPFRIWMPVARLLARINTFLLMGVVYYAVFTPAGCLMRLFGQDLLEERWEPKASSYWKPKEPQTDPGRFERMF